MIPATFKCPICGAEVNTNETENYGVTRIPNKYSTLHLLRKFCNKCGHQISFYITKEKYELLDKSLEDYYRPLQKTPLQKNLFTRIKEFFKENEACLWILVISIIYVIVGSTFVYDNHKLRSQLTALQTQCAEAHNE